MSPIGRLSSCMLVLPVVMLALNFGCPTSSSPVGKGGARNLSDVTCATLKITYKDGTQSVANQPAPGGGSYAFAHVPTGEFTAQCLGLNGQVIVSCTGNVGQGEGPFYCDFR